MADESKLFRLNEKYQSKCAFITGAGSGLGFAFARTLAKLGWNIGISDVDEERLHQSAQMISERGGKPFAYKFDVSNYDEFKTSVENFVSIAGALDIGINNAGVGCAGHIDELSVDVFRRVIDINLMGVVNGCHVFVPIMKLQKSGHILNVASAAAFVSAPRMSAYNASKAAVVSLSETLRSELNEYGVLVSVLMPTYVRTNIGRDCIGTEEGKGLATMMVNASQLNPDAVAIESLARMQNGDLYLVLPEEARFLWRFKRLFPDAFWKFILGEVKKKLAKLELAQK